LLQYVIISPKDRGLIMPVRFIKIKIKCPVSYSQIIEATVKVHKDGNGKLQETPFNGCDYYHPCDKCIRCYKYINSLNFDDIYSLISDIINIPESD
jgi:hypothetical protein